MPKKQAAQPATEISVRPARTRLELLRAVTYNGNPEIEERAFRREFTELIVNAISGMGSLYLQEVSRFIDIAEHNRGCATPAEQFITKMVMLHYSCCGLTPDMVAEQLDLDCGEGFRADFESLLDERRHFDRIYTDSREVAAALKEPA